MDGSNDQSASSVNANSIKITDVTQDGDTLTFAITSQKISIDKGSCVFRTYEDFDWLQQSLFSQEDVAGLHGVIFPPLPAKPLPSSSHTQARALKHMGFLAVTDNWQLYCKALQFYLQQVAAHSILGKSNMLPSFLSSTESPGKQHSKKGILDRLSHAMEEMRKEGHKDVDEFFHNERESSSHVTALFKATTEKFLDTVLTKQRLALACGHFSTSLRLCVAQDSPSAVASKICLKLSDIMDAVKSNLDKVSENDACNLGLGLDLESRHQEAKREMLFRRTCKLVELEVIIRNAEKAKPHKKAVMDKIQTITQKEFNLISSVAKEEEECNNTTYKDILDDCVTQSLWKQLGEDTLMIEWYHKARVSVLRDLLTRWCEKQLHVAKESAALFSQHLEAFRQFPV